MVNYLTKIADIWDFILHEQEDLRGSVDPHTVLLLETLVPALSSDDCSQIWNQTASRALFPLITDPSLRARIQSRLEQIRELILSLSTFF